MIHVIITTANIPEFYEKRKTQYIQSIEACLKYARFFDSYTILECSSKNEEYLNNYNTYYSKEENQYSNKGLNETNHIRSFLQQLNYNYDESIIKLSGRYVVEDSYFFEKVLALHDSFDSIMKNDNDVYAGKGYHTFFYYIKKKLLIETINSLEFSSDNDRPIEWDFKNYLMTKDRHAEIDRLGIIAYQGTDPQKIFYS